MSGIDLGGTVVAMTGASVGLGKSMSIALAKAGARVVLAAPETDLLDAVASEIEAAAGAGRTHVVRTDIAVRGDCERLLAESIRRFGKLDVLVNNARRPVRGPGLPPAGNFLPFWESNPDIWQESVHVNVNGTFLLSHVVTPHLIANGWGRIVNINTSLGGLSQSRNSPYGVTKAALESATLIFAADLAGTGVTVNTLLPGGPCDTDPSRPPDPKLKLLPVDIMDPAIVWLASKRSDGKTGGRYIGRLWNEKLPPAAAAAGAFTQPALRMSGD
ncbi:MAG: SDR family NAD(P)-dependent oxidoreductase [Alphaproteobacteria bacterium]|nr:SDR family NAD(P)-dependent oxidoreductase [Alphaproteobacteria bacterium]